MNSIKPKQSFESVLLDHSKNYTESERAKIHETLLFIANNGGVKSGDEFLNSISLHLAATLGVKYTLIDTVDRSVSEVAETVSLCVDGVVQENVSYSLVGTPCDTVLDSEVCIYNCHIQELFPNDQILIDWHAESYAGISLWDSKGNTIGLIAVVDVKPFTSAPFIDTILHLVAVRVSAELERVTVERQLYLSEHRYRSTFHTAGISIATIDLEGKFLTVNKRFTELFRCTKEQIIGQDYLCISLDDQHDIAKERVDRVHNAPSDNCIYEKNYKRFDDTCFLARTSLSLIRDQDGELQYYSAIIADITESKKNEEELVLAKQRAEEASFAKSQFLANMSHELRTPLNAIIGFTEIMQHRTMGADLNQPKYKEYLSYISQSGQHLLSLINDVLVMAKIESGQQQAIAEEHDINDTVQSAINIIKGRAQNHGLKLVYTPLMDATNVWIDKRHLDQVLFNVLDNAIKFSPDNSEVKITLADEGDTVTVRIMDEGIGISVEDTEKVFAPFEQIDNVMTRQEEGTGLGLAISVKLMKLNEGNLELDTNCACKGACLVLTMKKPD